MNTNETEKPGNGNRERMKQAYISLFENLGRAAALKVGSEEEANDIVGDVFLKVLQNPRAIEDCESLPSYLYTCVHNGCMDHLKRQKIKRKYEEYMSDVSDSYQQLDNDTPLYLLILKESETEVLNAVDKLSPRCKEALLGRLEGLSYQEIADKLNISVHTVRKHISKGINKLRKYFGESKK